MAATQAASQPGPHPLIALLKTRHSPKLPAASGDTVRSSFVPLSLLASRDDGSMG